MADRGTEQIPLASADVVEAAQAIIQGQPHVLLPQPQNAPVLVALMFIYERVQFSNLGHGH